MTQQSAVQFLRPTRQQAEEAVKTLILWAGDDPTREGLMETPRRVVRTFEDFFSGYTVDPREYLAKTFKEVGSYDEMVLLKDIRFGSHCEHHMVPFIGHAHVAYLPNERVVGISKLARVVELYARRLQIQEKMTVEIAEAIERTLAPRGVAVLIDASHQCMSMRGVCKPGVTMLTSKMTGAFKEDPALRQEFFAMVGATPSAYTPL